MTAGKKVKNMIIEVIEKIKKEYQPEKIILFGSYAHGSPDRNSDIDLLIIKETDERPIDRRVKVAKIISDPKRLVPFELIVLTPEEVNKRLEVGDQFVETILQNGEVLYAA